MPDHGHRIAYHALRNGTEVFDNAGKRLGVVQRVVADAKTQIFKDVVIDTKLGPGGLKLVDSRDVEDIYERALVLKLSAAEVEALPKP
ncbi:MAG: PRC-barrel domain-containing protein [Solirubrobacteraceae bacterium]